MKSKMFSLNSTDIGKIFRGALVVGLAAIVTFIAQELSSIDFGGYTGLVIGLAAVIINAAKTIKSDAYDYEKARKIVVGAFISMGGVLLTYLADTIPGIDLGSWTPAMVVVSGILINTARKWLSGYDY